ncbi:MAG: ATP-grasp domain-containing protein [Nitrosopumilus sp.]|nr:ATP-grasp domain-containing protein [Nitrosopumilus sp.]
MRRKVSNVLVPGASAPAGINTIKSLKLANFKGKVLSTDSNALSAGFYLSDYSEVIPEVDSNNYLEVLFKVIDKYDINVLMPSSGHDIFPFSENKEKLKKNGVIAVVSDRDVLEICRDKILTFEHLNKKFNLPFTTDKKNNISEFPIIAKPRYGKGSRDIIRIDDYEELDYVDSKYSNMIFQEYLPGEEYTIDVLSDMDSNPITSVPRVRMQTRGGISTKGKIVLDKELIEESFRIVKHLNIIGPSCVQVKKDKDNGFKLVEINPRLGGGTIFSTLAGANFPKMIIDMVEGRPIKISRISEVTILRYFEEIVIDGKKNTNRIGKDMLTSSVCRQ